MSPNVPSKLGTSQEDYGEMPVPEDPPAVNEPLQPEPLLTRLRPRKVLPERLSIHLGLENSDVFIGITDK